MLLMMLFLLLFLVKRNKRFWEKADNIALGTTRAYQDNTYLTKYENNCPIYLNLPNN